MAQSISRTIARRTLDAGESIRIPLVLAESKLLYEVGILVLQSSESQLHAALENTTRKSLVPEDPESGPSAGSLDGADKSAAEAVNSGEYSLPIHTSEADSVMERVTQALEDAIVTGASRRGLTMLLAKISHHCGRVPPSFTLGNIILYSVHAICGGGFADIFKGNLDGQVVALKRFRIFTLDEQHSIEERFCKETVIWRYLCHPHVLPFIGIDDRTFSQPFTGIDDSTFTPRLCMVSPWMNHGNMLDFITKKSLRADTINVLLLESCQGLKYLHEQKVIHGDLRCANIFIDDGGHARLADFGLSFVVSASQSHGTNNGGSIRWNAPELFLGDDSNSTRRSDIYAFGCVCLEAYTRKAPFSEIRLDSAVMARILKGARPKRPSQEQCSGLSIHDPMWTKVEQCWTDSPSERPSVDELIYALSHLPVLSPYSAVLEPRGLQLHRPSDDSSGQSKHTLFRTIESPSMARMPFRLHTATLATAHWDRGVRVYTMSGDGDIREGCINLDIKSSSADLSHNFTWWPGSLFGRRCNPGGRLCALASNDPTVSLFYETRDHDIKELRWDRGWVDTAFVQSNVMPGTDMAEVHSTDLDRVILFFQDAAGYLCYRMAHNFIWGSAVRLRKAAERSGIAAASWNSGRDVYRLYFQDENFTVREVMGYFDHTWLLGAFEYRVLKRLSTMAAVAWLEPRFELHLYLQDGHNTLIEFRFDASERIWLRGEFETPGLPKTKIAAFSRQSARGSLMNILWLGPDGLLHQQSFHNSRLLPATICYIILRGPFVGAWIGEHFRRRILSQQQAYLCNRAL